MQGLGNLSPVGEVRETSLTRVELQILEMNSLADGQPDLSSLGSFAESLRTAAVGLHLERSHPSRPDPHNGLLDALLEIGHQRKSTLATAEKGKIIFEAVVTNFVKLAREFKNRPRGERVDYHTAEN